MIEIVGEQPGGPVDATATATPTARRARGARHHRRRAASSSPTSTTPARACGASRSRTSRRGTTTGPTARRRTPSRRRPAAAARRRAAAEERVHGDGSIIGCETRCSARRSPSPARRTRSTTGATGSPGRLADRALEIPLTGRERPGRACATSSSRSRSPGATFTQPVRAAPEPALLVHLGRHGRLRPRHVQGAPAGDDPHRLPLRPRRVRRAEGRSRPRSARIGGAEFDGRARTDGLHRSGARPHDEAEAAVGGFDARGAGLGGWTLDAHHAYDPRARTRATSATGGAVERRAGHHTARGHRPAAAVRRPGRRRPGDGGAARLRQRRRAIAATAPSRRRDRLARRRPDPAHPPRRRRSRPTPSGIGSPRGIALGPDGEPLRRRRPNLSTVRRGSHPTGPSTPFAGGGSRQATAGPATQRVDPAARPRSPPRPDGSVYIANGNASSGSGPTASSATVAGGNFGQAARRRRAGHAGAAGLRRRHRGRPGGRALHRPSGQQLGRRQPRSAGSTSAARSPPSPAAGPTRTCWATEGRARRRRSASRTAWTSGPTGRCTSRSCATAARRPPRSARTASSRRSPAAARRPPAAIAATAAPPCAPISASVQGVAVAPDGARVRRPPRRRRTSAGWCAAIQPAAAARRRGFIPSPDGCAGVRVRRRRAPRPHRRRPDRADACSASATTARAGSPAITDARRQRRRASSAPAGAPTAIVAPGGQRTELTVERRRLAHRLRRRPRATPRRATYHAERADGDAHRPARRRAPRSSYDASGLLTRDEDPTAACTTLVRAAMPPAATG